ncbi:hypothetical protein I302_100406 [Kwoniella bestiolae CBS 10118]|uniref:Uncharacterized protein n=1 Tax=Kwoniella bestiolae CBS 10118 TaxID=1296100 RepID=A0A1B9G4Z0_9TREE|nr:hypothetical protein I302_03781 [Kwoniella bestiolae CBS 10118]OCF26104.1 hypothetical protein I302_03781 [Kwoniella bestiolae CBS 10118]
MIIPKVHIDDIAFFDPYEAFPRPPREVKSVTIIFDIFPIRQIISQSVLSQRRRQEKYANIQKMVEDQADARITFVNLEQCDEYYSNNQIAQEMRQAIEEHLDGIDERWWSREKKEVRKRMVHFRRMGEWVDEMLGRGEEEGFWRWTDVDVGSIY